MDNKKIYEGWELAKAIKEGKFKEGTKFKNEYGSIFTVKKYGDGKLALYAPGEHGNWATSMIMINNTFTPIELELYYFSKVRNSGKKMKVKCWDSFYTLQETLRILAEYNSVAINEAFNKKIWEVEE